MWTLFRPSYVKLCKVFIHVLKFSIFPVSSFPPSLGPMMCPHKIWHLSGAHKYVHRGTLNTQKRIFSTTIPHLLQLYRHVALCVFSHLFIYILHWFSPYKGYPGSVVDVTLNQFGFPVLIEATCWVQFIKASCIL